MAVKTPVLLPSCTITSSGAIRVYDSGGGGTEATITIPAGRYWTYPGGSVIEASDSIDAVGLFAYLWDAAYGGQAAEPQNAGPTYLGATGYFFQNLVSSGSAVYAASANTTANGRTLLTYMGWDPRTSQGAAANVEAQGLRTEWALLPESGDVDEKSEGFGAVVRLGGGAVFTGDLGEPMLRRTITLDGIPGGFVNRRQSASDTSTAQMDASFEHLVWRWAAKGEMVRYYADRSATNAYLTAALTSTAVTCSVSTTSFANGQSICIDGEWVGVTSGGGTANLTITRHNGVAHSKYAPVSSDFVGTYVLAVDGGNINMRQFDPSRRAVNQDRWDMEIALVRTSWS